MQQSSYNSHIYIIYIYLYLLQGAGMFKETLSPVDYAMCSSTGTSTGTNALCDHLTPPTHLYT